MGMKANKKKGSVLVVDDDYTICQLLKEIISEQGYDVDIKGDGESALQEIAKKSFDLVFLDLKLPGMNGLEILEAIKERNKAVLVVIVTAYIDEPMTLKAMSLGPLLLVQKPFKEKDIIEILNLVAKGKNIN
jgi:two-component system response regulator HydG